MFAKSSGIILDPAGFTIGDFNSFKEFIGVKMAWPKYKETHVIGITLLSHDLIIKIFTNKIVIVN